MPYQLPITEILVQTVQGVVKTTSHNVAAIFGKQHYNVLRDIEKLDCSEDFRRLNFEVMLYEVKIGNNATRQEKMYEMTRDGFTFLAMGFTGSKASAFKEAYIAAFNRMEAELNSRQEPPMLLN